MKIILEGGDITKAMVAYISGMGVDLTGKDVTTSIFAGRSANGNTITLDIQPAKQVVTPTVEAVQEAIKAVVVEEPVAVEIAETDSVEEPSDDVDLFANNG